MSPAQLEQALEEQRRRRGAGRAEPLGALLIQLGLASDGQVRHALRLQTKLAWPPEGQVPLAVRLIDAGVVSPSIMVTVIEEARGGDLAALLVERQVVQPAVLAYFQGQGQGSSDG